MIPAARIIILVGLLLLVVGGVLYLAGRLGISLPLGRLPGDIRVETENIRFYFPITTMILISVVLSVLFNIAIRLLGRK